MRVAVIGGAGFVGRHVVARLIAGGHEVTTVDVRAPAVPQAGEATLQADILRGTSQLAARLGRVDHLVWLAAAIRHAGVDEHAEEDVRLSVEAPRALLAALSPAPGALAYLSSVQVYGRPARLPVDEDHPTDPFTSYGVAKLLGEQVLAIAGPRRGTAVTSLRVAFVYGPGQHGRNVLPRFLAAVRRGEPPVVHGPGDDLRDDVYVGDVARAVALALERRAHGAFNIASGRPHTLLDVARAACRLGPPGLVPRHEERPSSWIDRTYAIDRARVALDLPEATPFDDGVRAMWDAGDGS